MGRKIHAKKQALCKGNRMSKCYVATQRWKGHVTSETNCAKLMTVLVRQARDMAKRCRGTLASTVLLFRSVRFSMAGSLRQASHSASASSCVSVGARTLLETKDSNQPITKITRDCRRIFARCRCTFHCYLQLTSHAAESCCWPTDQPFVHRH